jgi:hypothetical protein
MKPKTQKQAAAKWRRDTREKIDAILDALPAIGDCQILHEHRGQWIYLSLWRGNNPMDSTKYLRYHRAHILACGADFAEIQKPDIDWLATKE